MSDREHGCMPACECMHVRVYLAANAMNDPHKTQRLEIARGVDVAQVDHAPAKLLQQRHNHFGLVVATNEHVRWTAGE